MKHQVSVSLGNISNNQSDVLIAEKLRSGTQDVLKYASLVTLTVQNAALNLTMRMARTQKDLFLSSTAVVMAETVKLITCLGMVYFEEGGISKWLHALRNTVVNNPMDTFKVAIPSMVYTIQNNLIYIGATHLDAATCSVTYQLKILTTALMSVLMLRKKLSGLQWIALILLFLGVALVQLAQVKDTPTVDANGRQENPMLGFMAIMAACCLSAFAGVYFEKILKGSDISLWMRNVQLSTVAVPFGLLTVFVGDYGAVQEKGFFFGYNMITWVVILLQAIGGLVVAVVVKHADNILKGFATSMAIVLLCVVSMYAFDFHLTTKFAMGTGMVIVSIFMYSVQPPVAKSEVGKI